MLTAFAIKRMRSSSFEACRVLPLFFPPVTPLEGGPRSVRAPPPRPSSPLTRGTEKKPPHLRKKRPGDLREGADPSGHHLVASTEEGAPLKGGGHKTRPLWFCVPPKFERTLLCVFEVCPPPHDCPTLLFILFIASATQVLSDLLGSCPCQPPHPYIRLYNVSPILIGYIRLYNVSLTLIGYPYRGNMLDPC